MAKDERNLNIKKSKPKAKKSGKKSGELTPMMKQYMEIKAKNPDKILFYRLGDFYEMFFEDAKVASMVLGITLTTRGKHLDEDIPLAGFPHHHLESYLNKMVKAGYRVVVCDQIENPKHAKGVVKRDIVEIVSAGTALSDALVERNSNNYLFCATKEKDNFGFAFCDITTGEFQTGYCSDYAEFSQIVLKLKPVELVVSDESKLDFENFKQRFNFTISKEASWKYDPDFSKEVLDEVFPHEQLSQISNNLALSAAGVLLNYIKENLRSNFSHINKIDIYTDEDFVKIDDFTQRNLELLEPLNAYSPARATLYNTINYTVTAMGARYLKKMILNPHKNLKTIIFRQNAVTELVENKNLRRELNSVLKEIYDLERLVSKISTGKIIPHEMVRLKLSLAKIPEISELISKNSSEGSLVKVARKFTPLQDCIKLIETAFVENPPINVNEGGFIKSGFNQEMDELIEIIANGKDWILKLQEKVRGELDIPQLKVGFNRVFGYYFEVSKKHRDNIPDNFIKKQTLANAERFINEELKVLEDKVLNADERLKELEKELLEEIRNDLKQYMEAVRNNARVLAELDFYSSLAICAAANNYTKPDLHTDQEITIEKGRHPVIEKLLADPKDFIPNDLKFNAEERILIITGPNMSGKSTYLRQSALIVLLSQMGSYVPAKYAKIGLVDKIFTRVGASDNLAAGESTFLVEMKESANILKSATDKSLIVFDEVGRGTSTFDGLSIAWSIVEYLHNTKKLQTRTLFATHYHELTDISRICPKVKNYSVSVKKYKDEIIFMRKIIPGGADHSYGIYVAKLAGLPEKITDRADEILKNLEKNELTPDEKPKLAASPKIGTEFNQMSLFTEENDVVRDRLKELSIENLTPLQALMELAELKKIL